jgi:hypothetical protein
MGAGLLRGRAASSITRHSPSPTATPGPPMQRDEFETLVWQAIAD